MHPILDSFARKGVPVRDGQGQLQKAWVSRRERCSDIWNNRWGFLVDMRPRKRSANSHGHTQISIKDETRARGTENSVKINADDRAYPPMVPFRSKRRKNEASVSMFSKTIIAFGLLFTTVVAAAPPVFTQEKVYQKLVEKSPFIVQATSTIVWTASPSVTATQAPLLVTSAA